MGKLSVALAVIILAAASCAVDQERKGAASSGNKEETTDTSEPGLAPPRPLADEWSRWLVGQWDCSAESDLPGYKAWIRGKGQMIAELALGGQFLLTRMEGKTTRISDEYMQHLRQNLHVSEEDIQALQNLAFAALELRSIDPQSGRIVAYLFDSWRCAAQGTGKREGNKEIMEWKWTLAGAGTSVRTTEKVSDDKIRVTEKYTLSDGSTMEDRAIMMRRQSSPAGSGDLALLMPR